MSAPFAPATFLGGPWDGRRDISVKVGTRTVEVPVAGGLYRYNDHDVIRGDGTIVRVGFRWEPLDRVS